MFEIRQVEEEPQGSDQMRQLQESFLQQMVKEDWLSTEPVRNRLRQLKLTALAGEGLKLRYAAIELKVPSELMASRHKDRLLTHTLFQQVCRETAGRWKHIYPFGDEADPLRMYFLIPSKEGVEHANRAERFIEELLQKLKDMMELDCSCAAGLEVKGLKRVENAFASCLCALHRTNRTAAEGWIEAGTSMVMMTWLSPEEERRLARMIELTDLAMYAGELDLLFEVGEREQIPFDISMYKSMRLLLLLTAIARKFECSGTALGKFMWNSHKTLAACTSHEALKQQLHELGLLVMEEVTLARNSRISALPEAVRRYMERNYGCELSLAAAAQLFGLEEHSLSRQFKQHVGIPLADYVAKIRMAKAEQLLQADSLKLQELALLVGYSSLSHFVSAFKKFSGKSPKEYRERLQRTR
ncbi:helix-turn-helix transcriptional regulator [Paenibacillus tianjinensis]|uniref:Helix-turn-helix transcriptional regulator n=1 Tax=Paenibacillus tianjinensis TaxID=2810347 RepID=A0ABX7LFB8_9BACL|nr:AraC family transcriptional regulator [Paenibacillus tianjinensis]QSF46747.1 helix-turn-helix transcriptional regulator [Paenibacillus tianjinensis]